jgi:benzylsuccinate CoA-transferase BbsE subunit
MSRGAERPYSGLRVVDLTRELGGYAARLFADLGADVIRVETGGIRPATENASAACDASSLFMNASKRIVSLDIKKDEGRQSLIDLVRDARLVFYDADDSRDDMIGLLTSVPGPRVVTVISYFGLTGPYANYAGSDLVVQALGGIAYLSGARDRTPLRIGGGQSAIVASIYAAVAAAAALWDTETNGARHLIDVSTQEAFAHSLQNAPQMYDLAKVIPRRAANSVPLMQGVFACSDGHVFLAAPPFMTSQWNDIVRWMEETGFSEAARLKDNEWQDAKAGANRELRAEFRDIFERFLSRISRSQVAQECIDRKILIAPVSTMTDLAKDPQFKFRDFFTSIATPTGDLAFPGAPYRLSEPVWKVRAPQQIAAGDRGWEE